jgi:hypothetical protein
MFLIVQKLLLFTDGYIRTTQRYETSLYLEKIKLMKQQLVVVHIILQTEIPALPDNWITNTAFVKILCSQT